MGLFQNILYPNTHHPFDIIPKIFVEGWSGWQRVIGSSNVFQQTDSDIKAYCIFDSDYHTDSEKRDRYADAESRRVNLHIWERKEIENYLLNPNVIYRYIQKKKRKGSLTVEDILSKMTEFANDLREVTTDKFATEIHNQDRSMALTNANIAARAIVESRWDDPMQIVCGKELIAKLSGWSKETFGVSFSPFALARGFTKDDICPEMRWIINHIESGSNFHTPTGITS